MHQLPPLRPRHDDRADGAKRAGTWHRAMKWTMQRYVLREVMQTWLAVTGVLVAILVSNQLSRVLGQAAENSYGRGVVLDLIALGAIMNLSLIVPVGLLLAV